MPTPPAKEPAKKLDAAAAKTPERDWGFGLGELGGGSSMTPLQHSDYAFSATVHAFQGRTMDNVIAVLDSTHQELTTQKIFYVEISRAKDSAVLITDDQDSLAFTLEQNTGSKPPLLRVSPRGLVWPLMPARNEMGCHLKSMKS